MHCIKCPNHIRNTDITNVVFNIAESGAIIGAFECPQCHHSYFIEQVVAVNYVPYIPDRRSEEQASISG